MTLETGSNGRLLCSRLGSVVVSSDRPSFLESNSCGVFTANNNEHVLPVHHDVPVQPDRVVTS